VLLTELLNSDMTLVDYNDPKKVISDSKLSLLSARGGGDGGGDGPTVRSLGLSHSRGQQLLFPVSLSKNLLQSGVVNYYKVV